MRGSTSCSRRRPRNQMALRLHDWPASMPMGSCPFGMPPRGAHPSTYPAGCRDCGRSRPPRNYPGRPTIAYCGCPMTACQVQARGRPAPLHVRPAGVSRREDTVALSLSGGPGTPCIPRLRLPGQHQSVRAPKFLQQFAGVAEWQARRFRPPGVACGAGFVVV